MHFSRILLFDEIKQKNLCGENGKFIMCMAVFKLVKTTSKKMHNFYRLHHKTYNFLVNLISSQN